MEAAGSLGDGQEHAQREQALMSALTDAQSSLSNLQRLHEASQKQLFSMQTRSEDEQVNPWEGLGPVCRKLDESAYFCSFLLLPPAALDTLCRQSPGQHSMINSVDDWLLGFSQPCFP